MAKATGTVTLNGKPARGFAVVFHPTKGRPASGTTDSGGRFSLSTFSRGDGCLLGEQVVTVADAFPDGPPPMGVITNSRVPKKYSDQAASPLRASVKDGEKNDFTFELKSP